MTNKFDGMTSRDRQWLPGPFAAVAWLGAAALGGSFVLGCGGGVGDGSLVIPEDQMMAISTAGQIKIYDDLAELATTGAAPVPAQTIIAANVLSVAFDSAGNLYYLANNGSVGSNASFFSCPLPSTGLPFATCTAVGGVIPGGQWLAINASSTVFATSRNATTGSVVSFPLASGPPASPSVVYTSTTAPAAYGGIAVDASNTLYVTEQGSATSIAHKLFKCTSACQGTSGSQLDLTANITSGNPDSAPGGPLATNLGSTNLFVGAASTNPRSPQTRPVAFVCAAGSSGGLSCQARTATFPLLFGADSPFVNSVGIAASDSNEVYDAALLDDGGDTAAVLGPSFFGFLAAGPQFACSSTPSTCRVNQLPSVPINSMPASVPYGLAISPLN
ncbi:MAG: hypothetical protein Q8Q73_04575 [Stagnimonas sp.]|nr:hypothetical protein [Stagnimonas sp.]